MGAVKKGKDFITTWIKKKGKQGKPGKKLVVARRPGEATAVCRFVLSVVLPSRFEF